MIFNTNKLRDNSLIFLFIKSNFIFWLFDESKKKEWEKNNWLVGVSANAVQNRFTTDP